MHFLTTERLGWLSVLFFTCFTANVLQADSNTSLSEARKGFKTSLRTQRIPREPVEEAPANIFQTLKYPAPAGELAAYLSPDPGDGQKHPAIIWIVGGDCNSIGDVWSSAPRANDQTAVAYRKAGIIMMFPSLRGGNKNPGVREGFLGEVDDILAAGKYLRKVGYIDPARIYLGGHSTGGTLALLVAESTDQFRAVFSFGPVHDVSRYGSASGFLPFDLSNAQEVRLRSPGFWLSSIQSPTWVFEGVGRGNVVDLRTMAKATINSNAHLMEINGADHFSALAPMNELIAKKILGDTGTESKIAFTKEEVSKLFGSESH